MEKLMGKLIETASNCRMNQMKSKYITQEKNYQLFRKTNQIIYCAKKINKLKMRIVGQMAKTQIRKKTKKFKSKNINVVTKIYLESLVEYKALTK